VWVAPWVERVEAEQARGRCSTHKACCQVKLWGQTMQVARCYPFKQSGCALHTTVTLHHSSLAIDAAHMLPPSMRA